MTDPQPDPDPTARPQQVGEMAVADGASDREVVFTRVFRAPRHAVFRAWTDPALLARWWGPHGYKVPSCEVDLRPGGQWRIVMRGPGGDEYPAKGIYLEIAEPSRLVMTDVADEMPDGWNDILNSYRQSGDTSALHPVWTVTFEERNDDTIVTVVSQFASVDDLEAILKMGATEGWSESFEKLAAVLAS